MNSSRPELAASFEKAGVGIVAPAAALKANPIANAVAVVSLEDINGGEQVPLPEGAIRLAVSIKVRFDAIQSRSILETLVLASAVRKNQCCCASV